MKRDDIARSVVNTAREVDRLYNKLEKFYAEAHDRLRRARNTGDWSLVDEVIESIERAQPEKEGSRAGK